MLKGIVRHQKKAILVLAAILIIGWLIGPALAPLVGDFIQHLRRNWAGEVFGQNVSWRQYRLLRNRLEGYAKAFGGRGVSEEQFWTHLVYLKEAERLQLDAGSKDVSDFIVRRFGMEGKLSAREYRALLGKSGLRRKEFEECVRDAIRKERLVRLVLESVKITDRQAWQAYKYENTEYSVKYLSIPFEHFLGKAEEPSEEELKGYFAAHKEDFREPEGLRVAILGVLYDALEKEITISEEEAYAFYEENIAKYAIEREETTGESEGDATEEIEEEATVRYKPFETVREEIEKGLRKERARDLAWNLVDDEATGLFDEEGASFEEVRGALPRLSYWETDFFSAEEVSKALPIAGSEGYDEENRLRRFRSIAFDISEGEVSPPLWNDQGRFVFRILERRESYIPELAAVEEGVRQAVRNEKGRTEALGYAKNLRSKVEEDVSFESVASSADLKVEQEGPLKAGLLPPFTWKALSLPVGKTSDPIPSGEGIYLVQISEKKEPERATYSAEAEDYRKRLLAMERILFFSRWEASLFQRANLKVYEPKRGASQRAGF